MNNKVKVAEQIFQSKWHVFFDTPVGSPSPEELIGRTVYKAVIAAIVEAMGTNPESLQEIAKLATIEAEKIYADLNNHDCEKDFIDIRGAAISDFVDGAVWGAKQSVQAIGVQPNCDK